MGEHFYFLYEYYKEVWHLKASWGMNDPSRFGGNMNPISLIKEAKAYKAHHNNGRRVKIEIIL